MVLGETLSGAAAKAVRSSRRGRDSGSDSRGWRPAGPGKLPLCFPLPGLCPRPLPESVPHSSSDKDTCSEGQGPPGTPGRCPHLESLTHPDLQRYFFLKRPQWRVPGIAHGWSCIAQPPTDGDQKDVPRTPCGRQVPALPADRREGGEEAGRLAGGRGLPGPSLRDLREHGRICGLSLPTSYVSANSPSQVVVASVVCR